MKPITLSPTTLKLFLECPRCFWLEKAEGVKRPETPFPSLPNGMDGVIKKYFDRYRAAGCLPPELGGGIRGKLFPDQATMDVWRARGKSLSYLEVIPIPMAELAEIIPTFTLSLSKGERVSARYVRASTSSARTAMRNFHGFPDRVLGSSLDKESGVALIGLLDDCVVHNGLYSPLDYKTRGYPVKEDTPDYYQHQLDAYTLLLQENGYETDGWSYLVFYHPLEHGDGGSVTFHLHSVHVQANRQNALKLFRAAVEILSLKSSPPADADCGFCAWADLSRKIKKLGG